VEFASSGKWQDSFLRHVRTWAPPTSPRCHPLALLPHIDRCRPIQPPPRLPLLLLGSRHHLELQPRLVRLRRALGCLLDGAAEKKPYSLKLPPFLRLAPLAVALPLSARRPAFVRSLAPGRTRSAAGAPPSIAVPFRRSLSRARRRVLRFRAKRVSKRTCSRAGGPQERRSCERAR